MKKKLLALTMVSIMTFGSCSNAFASEVSASDLYKFTNLSKKCLMSVVSFNPLVDGALNVGSNMYGFATGEKTFSEATTDTAVGVATSAAIGTVATTSYGTAAIGTVATLGSTFIATVAPFAVPVALGIGSYKLVKSFLN